jgi:hypothetical protein
VNECYVSPHGPDATPEEVPMSIARCLRRPAAAPGLALVALLAGTAAAPAEAGEGIRAIAAGSRVVAPITEGCLGGLVNDDGDFEGDLYFQTDEGHDFDFDTVMRFTAPAAGRRIDQVCVCWLRRPGAPSVLEHEIVVFRGDGPGGEPGSLVAVIDAEAQGINTFATMHGYDVSAFDVRTPATSFYLGVRWNAGSGEEPDHRLCLDTGSPPVHRKFVKLATGSAWSDVDELFGQAPIPLPAIRALGFRAELAAPQQPPPPPPPPTCPVGPCVEDDETICLDGGRFEVKVDFDPPNDADALTEPARAERLTADTGYFTFFDPNNVEAVIKVLDACPVNDHHWVFAGGLTNVLTEITVCDKANGVEKRYTNPQGTPFQPIQDTAAFATCP